MNAWLFTVSWEQVAWLFIGLSLAGGYVALHWWQHDRESNRALRIAYGELARHLQSAEKREANARAAFTVSLRTVLDGREIANAPRRPKGGDAA